MRRSNGDGTVYRRDDGWEAAGYVDGRRRTFRAKTRRDGLAPLDAAEKRAKNGEPVIDEQSTVAAQMQREAAAAMDALLR
jgi:hypothetical protein